jgi:formate dehydrogenase assembly factor FdhD
MRTYLRVRSGQGDEVTGEVVREQPLAVYVNGEKFLMLLCSPMDLEALVNGYLWLEKIIGGLDEIRRIEASAVDGRAEVTQARSPRLTSPWTTRSGPRSGSGVESRPSGALFVPGSTRSPYPNPHRECGKLSAHLSF